MDKESILEKIINEMSEVSYTFSDEAMSEGLNKFFNLYRNVPVEWRDFVVSKSAKLLGYGRKDLLKETYDVGVSLAGIEDVVYIGINAIDNYNDFYKIHLREKNTTELIIKKLEDATRDIFFEWDSVKQEDYQNLIQREIVDKGYRCFAWVGDDGTCCLTTFAVADNMIPF